MWVACQDNNTQTDQKSIFSIFLFMKAGINLKKNSVAVVRLS